MRPQYDGSLPDAIRAVIDDLNAAVVHLEELLKYDHTPLVIRQLRPAAKELSQARSSLGLPQSLLSSRWTTDADSQLIRRADPGDLSHAGHRGVLEQVVQQAVQLPQLHPRQKQLSAKGCLSVQPDPA